MSRRFLTKMLFDNNSKSFRSSSKKCTDPYSTRRELSFELWMSSVYWFWWRWRILVPRVLLCRTKNKTSHEPQGLQDSSHNSRGLRDWSHELRVLGDSLYESKELWDSSYELRGFQDSSYESRGLRDSSWEWGADKSPTVKSPRRQKQLSSTLRGIDFWFLSNIYRNVIVVFPFDYQPNGCSFIS